MNSRQIEVSTAPQPTSGWQDVLDAALGTIMLSGINAGDCEFSRLVSTAIDKPTVLNAAEDKALEKK